MKNIVVTDIDKDYFKSIGIDVENKDDLEMKELKENLQHQDKLQKQEKELHKIKQQYFD